MVYLLKKIYVREQACIGCRLCEVYCKLAHSHSGDLIKAFRRESTRPLSRLWVEVKRPVSFSVRCQHCDEPACVYACLSGALSRDPDSGIVTVDEERCIGCWTCVLSCPFGVIRQDVVSGKAVKCDLCQGKDVPVCVANCPNEALICVETEGDISDRVLDGVKLK